MNDRALEDPIEEEDFSDVKVNFIETTEPGYIPFIDPKIEMPEPNTDLLVQIHVLGEWSGYYSDVYVVQMGGYDKRTNKWYYYSVPGRYLLMPEQGEVTGWRYFEQ